MSQEVTAAMGSWRVALAVVAVLGAAPGAAMAQGSQVPAVAVAPPPEAPAPRDVPRLHGFYRLGMAARYNPLGLFTNLTAQLRYRLYDSDSIALRENFVSVGPVGQISPAFYRVGIGVEVQPATVLNLSASYEWTSFFGNFNFLQSYPSLGSNWSDTSMRTAGQLPAGDPARPYSTSGTLFTLAGLLQLKVGPVAMRSNTRLFRFDLRLREGDRLFYEPVLDVALPNGGWGLTNDTDVLYLGGLPGLALGARYSGSGGFFGAEHGPLDVANARPIHRVGPFVAYTFFDDERQTFNAPTVVVLAQWFLQHPYRTGQDVPAALPWIAVGFQARGIL